MDQTNDQTQAQPVEQSQPVEQQTIEQKPAPEIEKYIAQIKELEKKANEAQNLLKQKEMAELQRNQEWQKVAEIKEKEAMEAMTKYEGLKEALVKREKYNALAQAALASGIRKEAISDLTLVDLKDLKVETTSEGELSVSGAEKLVTKLKTLKPHWFQSATPNVNPQTPSPTAGSSSAVWENLKKLEAEYKKNPTRENERLFKEAILSYKRA